ncbi:MAG: hypothetical protein K2H98_08020 [Duncaniella sp.]|nr:hypothetical protein [Duncaniella sp.]
MKFSEKERIARNIRRELGKKYWYKQSDDINWKIKGEYFFWINTLHIICSDFRVKPLYMDDLYWKIINPGREERFPQSLRGTGILGSSSIMLWDERFPKNLNKDFSAEWYEQILTQVFEKADETIESFFIENPVPDRFSEILLKNNDRKDLGFVLALVKEQKYEAAIEMAGELKDAPGVGIAYLMPDNTQKDCYEFIIDYCRAMINGYEYHVKI